MPCRNIWAAWGPLKSTVFQKYCYSCTMPVYCWDFLFVWQMVSYIVDLNCWLGHCNGALTDQNTSFMVVKMKQAVRNSVCVTLCSLEEGRNTNGMDKYMNACWFEKESWKEKQQPLKSCSNEKWKREIVSLQTLENKTPPWNTCHRCRT